MPKLKTHSGTKDRVKVSKNGKVRVNRANGNHFLQKKSASRKRRIDSFHTLGSTNAKIAKTKLGV